MARYRRRGETGLLDRSSAPAEIPNRTSEDRVEAISRAREPCGPRPLHEHRARAGRRGVHPGERSAWRGSKAHPSAGTARLHSEDSRRRRHRRGSGQRRDPRPPRAREWSPVGERTIPHQSESGRRNAGRSRSRISSAGLGLWTSPAAAKGERDSTSRRWKYYISSKYEKPEPGERRVLGAHVLGKLGAGPAPSTSAAIVSAIHASIRRSASAASNP